MLELAFTSPAVDRFDGPEYAMVIVAAISAVASMVGVAVANRSRQHSQVVRAQVENDHADAKNPNLRVDLDDKFETLEQSVQAAHKGNDRLMTKLTHVENEVGTVKDDVSLLRAGYRANRDDIDELMDTAAQESRRRDEEYWGPQPQTRRERREGNHAR